MQVRLFLLLVLAMPAMADPDYLNSGSTLPTDLPFSEAVRHGNTLYLSGQIGNVPGTLELAPGGMTGQAHQVMKNIRATLNAHGHDLGDLIKCTVMLENMDEWGDFNEVYKTYFEAGRYPARSAFGTSGLAVGAVVEVECIAAARAAE